MPGKSLRSLPLPVLALPADLGQFRKSRPLGNRPERRAGADCLQLLGIPDHDEFGARPFRFPDEPRELARADHAGFINDEDIAWTKFPPPGLPAIVP